MKVIVLTYRYFRKSGLTNLRKIKNIYIFKFDKGKATFFIKDKKIMFTEQRQDQRCPIKKLFLKINRNTHY